MNDLEEIKNDQLYKQLEENMHIDESSVLDKVEELKKQVSLLTKEAKAKWLLKSITHLDLTSLDPNDSTEKIKNLCIKAVHPMEIKNEANESLHTAAICIYPTKVKDALDIFKQENIKGIKIASVGAGFPSGKFPLNERLEEIKKAVEDGADEIDVVIDRDLVFKGEWENLLHELKQMRKACGDRTMKTILSTGELGSMKNIYIVSMLAMIAGSNFIKTSTGKEAVNATLPVGFIMCKAIRDFYKETGKQVGFKPAGGIKTGENILDWFMLIKLELGVDWMTPERFRIGASSVLDEIIKYYKLLTSNAA